MRVALVLPRYAPHTGGVERYVHELTRGLLAGGHEVHVVCFRADSDGVPGLVVRAVPVVRWHNAIKIASFARSADREVRRIQADFDVVHGFGRTTVHDLYRVGGGVHAAYLARMLAEQPGGVRALWQRIDPRNWVIRRIERDIFRRGERRFTAISRLCARDVEQHYGIPASEIEVIYNGVDVEAFHPRNRDRWREEMRRRHGVRPDETVLLFVGSGFERKGLDTLVAAAAELAKEAPLRVVVVGKGSEHRYHRLANRLGLLDRVHFLGPRRDLAEIYPLGDVFVLPTRYEPFGTVCLEAWATGLPVVVSRASGASEIMTEGEHGSIVEDANDAAELARKIRPLLSPAERERIAPLARDLACRHTIEANVARTVEIYREIARAKGREVR